jgi:hypothetical protein
MLENYCRPASAGRTLVLSALAFTAAGLLLGDQAAAETVKRGGTIVLARPEEPLSFNP